MPRIDLSASEIVFLFYFAFPYDIEAKLISKLTKISEATVSEWRNYYNERLGVYLDDYYSTYPFGVDERIVEIDVM